MATSNDSTSKGYRFIFKTNLPPSAQYASGDSIIVQADTPEDFEEALDALFGEDAGQAVLKKFAKTATQEVQAAPARTGGFQKKTGSGGGWSGRKATTSTGGMEASEKQVKLLRVLQRQNDMSDEDILEAAADITGGEVNALTSLTKKEASALIDALQGE